MCSAVSESERLALQLRPSRGRRASYLLSPAADALDMRELVFKACSVSVWAKVRPQHTHTHTPLDCVCLCEDSGGRRKVQCSGLKCVGLMLPGGDK